MFMCNLCGNQCNKKFGVTITQNDYDDVTDTFEQQIVRVCDGCRLDYYQKEIDAADLLGENNV